MRVAALVRQGAHRVIAAHALRDRSAGRNKRSDPIRQVVCIAQPRMTASELWDYFAKRVVILDSLRVPAIDGWWAHRLSNPSGRSRVFNVPSVKSNLGNKIIRPSVLVPTPH